jgi:hypothetical protein
VHRRQYLGLPVPPDLRRRQPLALTTSKLFEAADGATVWIWTCGGATGDNQKWLFTKVN